MIVNALRYTLGSFSCFVRFPSSPHADFVAGITNVSSARARFGQSPVKPRPHQQQRRSNIVECYKSNDSFENVERCFDTACFWCGRGLISRLFEARTGGHVYSVHTVGRRVNWLRWHRLLTSRHGGGARDVIRPPSTNAFTSGDVAEHLMIGRSGGCLR